MGVDVPNPRNRSLTTAPTPPSMLRLFPVLMLPVAVALVVLVELPGAVRPFEFMALAGHTQHRNDHQQQEKNFHRRAS